MNDTQIKMRNNFQSQVSAKVIKDIEAKFLDFSLRNRDESPAVCLSAEERLIYADYLESKGEYQNAQFFREYEQPKESAKRVKGKAKSNLVEIELFALDASVAGKLEVEPRIAFVRKGDKLFVQGTGKNKKRFYQTMTKWNIDDKDERVYIWK